MDSIDGKQQELDAAPAPSAAAPQASPTSTQSATPSAVASTSAAVPTHEASPPEVPTKPAAPAPNSKYRHQWYQSPNAVNLSVMAKGMKPDRAHVNITSNSLSVHIKAPG